MSDTNQAPQSQLERIHVLADERRANVDLYDFERESSQAFTSVLCCLIGGGHITDEALDWAINLVRESDARAIARRAGVAS